MDFATCLVVAGLLVVFLGYCVFSSGGHDLKCCKCAKELPDDGFVFFDDEGGFCRECSTWHTGFDVATWSDHNF